MAKVSIDIELVTAAFNKALKAAAKNVEDFQGSVDRNQKQVSSSFKKVDKSTENTAKGFTILRGSVASFFGNLASNAVSSLISSLRELGTTVIDNAIRLEQLETRFTTLTGSADQAKATLEDLQEFAATTPFQLESLAEASATLLAFQTPANQVIDRLQQIGDVASAVGKPIGDIALIFGQVSNEGVLTGERLRQFQERGIGITAALEEATGKTGLAFKKLVSEGGVSFDQFEKAFISLSQEGGQAFEGMIKQSQTLGGVLSTLSDNFALVGNDIGQQFLPILKEIALDIIDVVQQNRELIKQFASDAAIRFGQTVKFVIDNMKVLAEFVQNNATLIKALGGAIAGAGVVLTAFIATLVKAKVALLLASASLAATPWGIAAIAVAGLTAGIVALIDNLDTIVGNLQIFGATLIDSMVEPLQVVASALATVIGIFDEDLANSINNSVNELKRFSTELREQGKKTLESSTELKDGIIENNNAIIQDEQRKFLAQKAIDEQAIQAKREAELAKQNAIKEVQASFAEEEAIAKIDAEIALEEANEGDIEKIRELELRKIEVTREAEIEKAKIINDAIGKTKAIEEANQKAKIARIKINNNAEVALEKDKLFKIQEFDKLSNKQRLENLKGTLGTISTLQSSSSKSLFAIGKAAAIATATIDGYSAVQKALSSAPPPFNFALAALVGAATGANISKIAATQPPSAGSFQDGGIVPGTSFSGDNLSANVNSGELILNRSQQQRLFNIADGTEQANTGALTPDVVREIVETTVSNMQVVLMADDNEIAKSASRGVSNGIVIGVSS